MQYEEPDPVLKVILLTMNALGLVGLCAYMIRHWHALPPDAHFWGIYLVVAFLLLWESVLRGRSIVSIMIGLSVIIGGVIGISFRAL